LAAFVSFCAWLLKRRGRSNDREASVSWLSRRLTVEKDLMIARRTIIVQEAEITYLTGALKRAQETQELVQRVIATSALNSANSSPASTPSTPGSAPRSDHS
jgi:hypothetical protein